MGFFFGLFAARVYLQDAFFFILNISLFPPPTTIVSILAKGIRDTRWGNICLQLNGISAIIKYPLLLSLDCGSLPIQMEYEPHDYVSFQVSFFKTNKIDRKSIP